jgi:SAM dependent carboxyl methyltransferase
VSDTELDKNERGGPASIGASPSHGVMEGNGAYNRHAAIQAGAAALATPLLEKALREVSLGAEEQPVLIADYGSSQGKNSLGPMRVATQNLRARIGPNRPIFVYHIDQASNDFNSLFRVMTSDPERYALDVINVFPCAIGRSFYEQVLPARTVHLAWSCYAAQWLRRVPSPITGHFWSPRSTGAERKSFERQAAEDWEAFLILRALEMRAGARLLVVLPSLPQDGHPGITQLMDDANEVLAEMVDEGTVTAEEKTRMVLGSHLRCKSELEAPFTRDGLFHNLVLEDCVESTLPDASWAQYLQDGDEGAFAGRRALLFRSIFLPSLSSELECVHAGDVEAHRVFTHRLEDGLIRRQASHPAAADALVSTILVAKRE